jgi:ribosome-binding ATPase YchF (GTP1/OBG family)
MTAIRKESKPMLIAANKVDLPYAEENIERLRNSGYPVVACCAEAELALRRAAEKGLTDYKPGDVNFNILNQSSLKSEQLSALSTIKEKILIKWGSTGVQESINFAYFKLLGMKQDPLIIQDKRHKDCICNKGGRRRGETEERS